MRPGTAHPRKGRRRAKRVARRPGAAAPAREDLNLASRALLEEDSEARVVRPPPEDASVEDPLLDWPED